MKHLNDEKNWLKTEESKLKLVTVAVTSIDYQIITDKNTCQ